MPVEGFDISLTGFETPEIDLLLAEWGRRGRARRLPCPLSAKSDDAARAICGCLESIGCYAATRGSRSEFGRLMNGASAAAVFCDPPYNLRVSAIGGRGRIRHPEFAFGSGEMSAGAISKFLLETLGNGVRVSAEGAVHYICMDWRHIGELVEVGREIYGDMLNLVVWNKSNAGQGSFYRSQHELIGVFRVGDSRNQNNVELGRFGRNRSNVWTYPGVNAFGRAAWRRSPPIRR